MLQCATLRCKRENKAPGTSKNAYGIQSLGILYKRSTLLVVLLVVQLLSISWRQAEAQTQKPFYKGKTLRVMVPYAPGGSTDLAARIVGRHLGKHIPGNPTVFVQNMVGAGGVVGANYLYNVAKKDGLTIQHVVRSLYIDQLIGKPRIDFDFAKFGWIGSFNRGPIMLMCRTNSGYTSIDAIRTAAKPPRFANNVRGGINYIFTRLVAGALDLKITLVFGFRSGSTMDLGIERGDADCRSGPQSILTRSPWNRWRHNGFMTFLVQQGPKKSKKLPQNVPTIYELAPPKAKPMLDLMEIMIAFTEWDRPFAAPPGIPKERLQILREAFKEMVLKDSEFAAEAKKIVDWDGSYLGAEELEKHIAKVVAQPPEVIESIKKILSE